MAAKKRSTKAARRPQGRPAKKPRPRAGRVGAAPGAVLVVNMVPRSLSNETNQDSEPCLAVNPANTQEIAATAFTPDPMGGSNAPLYVSTDGGNTWWLNSIVPSASGSQTGTHDISVAFASAGGNLYGGILRDPTDDFERLRTSTFTNPTPMQTIGSRPDNDQPFTHAVTNAGKDCVYIGLPYQQLAGAGANSRWVTHFRTTTNGVNWNDLVLASTPANVPAKTFDPYLGDYDHLVAVGRDFFGVFSANNTPKQANFPNGARYLRNADFPSHTLLGIDNTTPVAVSINPFFFKVTG
jgi:hypothetical protein